MPDTTTERFERNYHNGELVIRNQGKAYTLAPPTFGQLRALDELVAIASQEAANRAAADAERAKAALEAGEEIELAPGEVNAAKHERMAEVMAWWRKAVELCGKGDLPPDDDLEPWFGNVMMMLLAQEFWMSFPILALGGAEPAGASSNGTQ